MINRIENYTVAQWQKFSTEHRLAKLKELENYVSWYCVKNPPRFTDRNGDDGRVTWANEQIERIKKSLKLSPEVYARMYAPPWWEDFE